MQKSLFVAGLDYSITSTELQQLFTNHGTVTSAKVITDKFTSQSKGFGFVDMETQADAQNCISALNSTSYKNRNLVVKIKEDKPKNDNGYTRNNQRSW